MAKQLTAKEKRFKEEYLISLNPRIAAEKAGYKASIAKTRAFQWISEGSPYFKTHLYEAIMLDMKKRSEKVEITQDMVIKELSLIAFADMKNYITINEDGSVQAKTWDQMPEGASRAVAEIKEIRRIMSAGKGGGEEIVLECRLGYKHHSKEKALELLGNHLGMWKEKVEHLGDMKVTFEVVNE